VSDPRFYARLKRLMRIVIPSVRSREAAMLALHSAFLLARTALSLYVADLDGRYVYLSPFWSRLCRLAPLRRWQTRPHVMQ
jgi:ATP-binding cassette subfamily D (ALD) long-chain fatty acid import protein